ncbi:response regulator transcription factor [Croceiramulus getboli]|nr:helix-turn-helix transcriptional regulator [Flavobacteriaceae bacterium YJPT1-3]
MSPTLSQERVDLDQLISRIQSVTAKDTRLMVNLFDLEKQEFCFANSAFAKGPYFFKESSWNSWFDHIVKQEMPMIKQKVNALIQRYVANKTAHPLVLHYHIYDTAHQMKWLQHTLQGVRTSGRRFICSYLYDFSNLKQIQNFLDEKGGVLLKHDEIAISCREQEVLQLVANGLSSKEISQALFISDHTVHSHRKNLMDKFQVHNTAQLIQKAAKQNII